MKKTIVLSLLALAAVVMAAAMFGCSKGGDAKNIAEGLEDALTDSMDFENGQKVDGAPPEGSASTDAPQIESVVMPEEFVAGEPFTIFITTKFATVADIEKTAVAVENAKSHIIVTQPAVEVTGGGEVRLYGILQINDKLLDKSFNIKFSLGSKVGKYGLYHTKSMKISPVKAAGNPAELAKKALEDVQVAQSATWVDGERPAGDGSPSAPQIDSINAPSAVVLGQSFDVSLYSSNVEDPTKVSAVIMGSPKLPGFWRITGFQTIEVPAAKVYAPKAAKRYAFVVTVVINKLPAANYQPVFIWALQTVGGEAGAYYPWQMTLDNNPADGDEEKEAEYDEEAGEEIAEEITEEIVDEAVQEEEPAEEQPVEEEIEEESEPEINLCDPDPCNGHGECAPATGACLCSDAYDGDKCDKCAEGRAVYPECVAWPPAEPWYDNKTCNLPACDAENGTVTFDAGGKWIRMTSTVATTCPGMIRNYGDPRVKPGAVSVNAPIPLGLKGNCIYEPESETLITGSYKENVGVYCVARDEDSNSSRVETAVLYHEGAIADGSGIILLNNLPEFLSTKECQVVMDIKLLRIGGEPCESDPCNGRGICNPDDGGKCICGTPYAGDDCSQCAPGYQDNNEDGTCEPDCETALKWMICNPENPKCDDSSGTPMCDCGEGMQDYDENGVCAPACTPEFCNGNGECYDYNGSAVCYCNTGWAPPQCGACDEGYAGSDCHQDWCSVNECQNNGYCMDEKCQCPEGFRGTFCEVPPAKPFGFELFYDRGDVRSFELIGMSGDDAGSKKLCGLWRYVGRGGENETKKSGGNYALDARSVIAECYDGESWTAIPTNFYYEDNVKMVVKGDDIYFVASGEGLMLVRYRDGEFDNLGARLSGYYALNMFKGNGAYFYVVTYGYMSDSGYVYRLIKIDPEEGTSETIMTVPANVGGMSGEYKLKEFGDEGSPMLLAPFTIAKGYNDEDVIVALTPSGVVKTLDGETIDALFDYSVYDEYKLLPVGIYGDSIDNLWMFGVDYSYSAVMSRYTNGSWTHFNVGINLQFYGMNGAAPTVQPINPNLVIGTFSDKIVALIPYDDTAKNSVIQSIPKFIPLDYDAYAGSQTYWHVSTSGGVYLSIGNVIEKFNDDYRAQKEYSFALDKFFGTEVGKFNAYGLVSNKGRYSPCVVTADFYREKMLTQCYDKETRLWSVPTAEDEIFPGDNDPTRFFVSDSGIVYYYGEVNGVSGYLFAKEPGAEWVAVGIDGMDFNGWRPEYAAKGNGDTCVLTVISNQTSARNVYMVDLINRSAALIKSFGSEDPTLTDIFVPEASAPAVGLKNGFPQDVFFSMSDGIHILRGGTEWTSEANSDSFNLTFPVRSITGTSPNNVWAMTTGYETGSVTLLRWDGAGWTQFDLSLWADSVVGSIFAVDRYNVFIPFMGGTAWVKFPNADLRRNYANPSYVTDENITFIDPLSTMPLKYFGSDLENLSAFTLNTVETLVKNDVPPDGDVDPIEPVGGFSVIFDGNASEPHASISLTAGGSNAYADVCFFGYADDAGIISCYKNEWFNPSMPDGLNGINALALNEAGLYAYGFGEQYDLWLYDFAAQSWSPVDFAPYDKQRIQSRVKMTVAPASRNAVFLLTQDYDYVYVIYRVDPSQHTAAQSSYGVYFDGSITEFEAAADPNSQDSPIYLFVATNYGIFASASLEDFVFSIQSSDLRSMTAMPLWSSDDPKNVWTAGFLPADGSLALAQFNGSAWKGYRTNYLMSERSGVSVWNSGSKAVFYYGGGFYLYDLATVINGYGQTAQIPSDATGFSYAPKYYGKTLEGLYAASGAVIMKFNSSYVPVDGDIDGDADEEELPDNLGGSCSYGASVSYCEDENTFAVCSYAYNRWMYESCSEIGEGYFCSSCPAYGGREVVGTLGKNQIPAAAMGCAKECAGNGRPYCNGNVLITCDLACGRYIVNNETNCEYMQMVCGTGTTGTADCVFPSVDGDTDEEDTPVHTGLFEEFTWNSKTTGGDVGCFDCSNGQPNTTSYAEWSAAHYFTGPDSIRMYAYGDNGGVCGRDYYTCKDNYLMFSNLPVKPDYITFYYYAPNIPFDNRFGASATFYAADNSNALGEPLFSVLCDVDGSQCSGPANIMSACATPVTGADGFTWCKKTMAWPAQLVSPPFGAHFGIYGWRWDQGGQDSVVELYLDEICISDADGKCIPMADGDED